MRLQLVLVLALAMGLGARVAHADGSVTQRDAYYLERSTRVIQPMLDGIFDVGTRGTVTGHLLVDAITSASASSGSFNAQPFTEKRYEAGLGYLHEFDQIRLGVDAKYSTESDYVSNYIGLHAEKDLAQKNAVVGLGAGYSSDKVSAASAQGPFVPQLACRATDQPDATSCPLTSYSVFVSASQILSRNALVAVTYDLSEVHGFQANAYRTVITEDGHEVAERHPDERLRQAVALSGRYYIPASQTTLVGAYRFYHDSWQVNAHTPELRIIQQVGRSVDASFMYRYYTQTHAYFFQNRYATAEPAINPFLSDDPKLSRYTGETLEAKLGIYGEAFDLSDSLAHMRFEGILAYTIQNNRFGNAIIAELAVTVPFSY